eukprot:SAG31_NODE_6154_length_2146_cov_1.617000_1_plen_60_part_10
MAALVLGLTAAAVRACPPSFGLLIGLLEAAATRGRAPRAAAPPPRKVRHPPCFDATAPAG